MRLKEPARGIGNLISRRIAREVATPPSTDRSYFVAAAELRGRRRASPNEGDLELVAHELRVNSQNGEDGVIAEILRRTGTSPQPYFVEFGIQRGHEGNCVALADLFGWKGLFIEGDSEDFQHLELKYRPTAVSTVNSMVTADNIEALLTQAAVPSEPDILSIDIDGTDYWVWRAIRRCRPRLVIVEFNSGLDPASRQVVPAHFPGWDGTSYSGTSLGALVHLAASKGYRHVHTEMAGVNAFFVRDDLPGDWIEPPARGPNYFLEAWSHPPDPHGRSYEVDPPI